MKRVVAQIAVIGMCIGMMPSAHALFHKKHKKGTFNLTANPLAKVNSEQPDKILFDKAMHALKKGRYTVARLDLQTLLNTYPETEYAMRAKLAIGDTWYREGGAAALTQAENEYEDFITFFPNTPEAAEAQMKVGDIYFQQMLKPDRDPANAEQAQQQYRTMIEDFPNSPLIPRAKQRLREVQEVLAQRQFEVGQFYFSRENWSAAIARLETLADTYPLYSQADQALVMLGDCYLHEAQLVSQLRLPAKPKAELVNIYDARAAAAWDRVVTRYPMAPNVEAAKDRLIAMGRPIPNPTAQEIAESEAEEGSRITPKLGSRLLQFFKSTPSTANTARVGNPSLTDPPPTLAPEINKQNMAMIRAAYAGKPIPGIAANGQDTTAAAISAGSAPPAASASAGQPSTPLQLESIPTQNQPTGTGLSVQVPEGGSGGTAVEVPGSTPNAAPAAAPAGSAAAQKAADDAVVQPVGPPSNAALPPVDKPAAAPDQINDVKGGGPIINTGTTASNGKKKKHPKAPYNSKTESSSRHKPKHGVHKLNPF